MRSVWVIIGASVFSLVSCHGGFDRDPCVDVTCSGHGTCAVVEGDQARCLCDEGYVPEGLECVERATDGDGDVDADADGDGDVDADADVDGDGDGDSDGDGDGDSDADGDTETDADDVCGEREHFCHGECVAIDDPNHCGRCDFSCDENEVCLGGTCFCAYASTDCEGTEASFCCPNESSCVDLASDVHHCGDCFMVCAIGEVCVDGACRCGMDESCSEREICCPDRGCTSVLTDEANCGPLTDLSGCGHACRPGVECFDGFCACGSGGDCSAAETCCFEVYCADIDSDTSNCGECGNVCRLGEVCESGHCICGSTCDDGNSCTEDSCVSSRCEHHTLDGDDDGYCAAWCLDADSGDVGDCEDGDCNDSNDGVYPGAVETCLTAYDDDCDADTNDRDAEGCVNFYIDRDDDGYGAGDAAQCLCHASGDYRATALGDCNDDNEFVNPGRPDVCNGVNDDCDGHTDDGEDECAGGADYCCGAVPACRECCDSSQCAGDGSECIVFICQ